MYIAVWRTDSPWSSVIGSYSESGALWHLHYFILIHRVATEVKVILKTETDLTNGGRLQNITNYFICLNAR